jgi:signal transduction histidine kinase
MTRSLAIELKRKRDQADAEKNLANAYENINKFKEALKFNISAGKIFDSLNNIDRKNTLAELMLKYETTKKDNEILEAKQQIIKQEKDKQLLELEKELSDKKVAVTIQQSKLKEKELLNEKSQILLKKKSDSLLKTTQILAQEIKINKAAKELSVKEKAIEKQTYWLFGLSFFLLSLFGIIYYQIKRKQSIEKQTKLEMEIAKQEALNKVQEERLRISRELHDNIGSHLTLMNATVEKMPLLNEVDLKPQIERVKNSLALSMKELRRTVWLMNKSKISLEELGIKLREFLNPVNTTQTKIKLIVTGNEAIILNELAAAHLFRIVQEGVNNALKHANASLVDIQLNGKNQTIHFLISDNGKGFKITDESKGNGIKNIEYRVKELKGSVEWFTNTEGGTQIKGYLII